MRTLASKSSPRLKWRVALVALLGAVVVALSAPAAQADWRGHGYYWHDGWYWGAPYGPWPGYWPYAYPPGYVYPYPAQAPVAVIQQQPVQAAQPGMWYYCDNPAGYYPYVATCASQFRAVPAVPPTQPPAH